MELQQKSLQEADQLDAQMADFYAQGRFEEAIPLALHALAIREKVLGPEHPDAARSLNNLAGFYQAAGVYAKAEPLYQRAISINEKILGPEDSNTAISLSNLASLYQATGAYAKAEPLSQRALSIFEKGSDLETTARALNNLAEIYRGTCAYAKAEPLYQRALDIIEKMSGPDDLYTSLALNNLAEFYRVIGAYSKAHPLCQRALEIAENATPPNYPAVARSLNNLASLYYTIGSYAKAEPLFTRALAIREQSLGPEHPDVAIALNNLGVLYKMTAEYGKAEPLYLRALKIRERVFGRQHELTAASLSNLGALYQDAGNYAKAEALYQSALEINEQVLGTDHSDTAISLNNLALLYEGTGDYARAEPLYQSALAIKENVLGPENPDTARALNNLASLYYTTGAYARAEPLYQRALKIFENDLGSAQVESATLLNNLGKLCCSTGAYAKAEPLFRQALAIREKALGLDHPLTAASLDSLAGLFRAVGAYAKAEPLYQRALAIHERVHGVDHPDTAILLNNLAVLYQDYGSYERAEPLFQRALIIHEKMLGSEHPKTANALNNLAGLYYATGAYEKAEQLYERALGIQENSTVRFLLSGSEARKLAYLQKREEEISKNVSLSLVYPRARSIGLIGVLQYKGRVLDAMSDSNARLRHSVSPEDLMLFDQLSVLAQQLSALLFRGPEKLSLEAYRERLNALSTEQERLQAELATRTAVLCQAITPITLDGVRKAVPIDAALVEWYCYRPFDPRADSVHWGVPRYVAYVLTRSGDPVAMDLGVAQPIDDLVSELRTALSDSASTYFKQVAAALFEKLIKPLQCHFARSERLLLSPDGALNLLPFAALVNESGEYLAQRFEITYLTSGRDLLRMSTKSAFRQSAVVLADPNYGQPSHEGNRIATDSQARRSVDLDRSGLVFAQLPGTAVEATALQSLLSVDPRNMLIGDHATEARLRELHGPHILHMATHGFFLNDLQMRVIFRQVGLGYESTPLPLSENPLLRSGLALAGANARYSGTDDDGILTAAEVAQLDLLDTQLVVLSACETGVGKVQTGEGVNGLRRALLLAGAQTQLVSLWKVNDAATQELMIDYYQRLLDGEGRSGALRAAQRAMMANPARQHPCYWAAFILIGNWTPLPAAR